MNKKIEEIVGRYKENFRLNDLNIYRNDPQEDIIMLRLWMFLLNNDDISKVMAKGSYTFYDFCKSIRFPTFLFYSTPEKGEINFAYWVKPVANCLEHPVGECTYWSTEKLKKQPKKHIRLATLSYLLSFEIFESLLSYTWQKETLEIHKKLGYEIVGQIPYYKDQPMVWITRLTKKNFETSEFYNISQRSL